MTDDEAPGPALTGWRRWVRGLVVAALAGGGVAWWAAAQLDTHGPPGAPIEFGFWAAFWGTVVGVLAFGVGLWGQAGRAIVMATLTVFAGLFVVWLFAIGAFTT